MLKQLQIPLLSLLLLLSGCQSTDSTTYEKLASAYAELLTLNERYNSPSDTLNKRMYGQQRDEILKRYGYTSEGFQKEMKAVFDSPEKAKVFFPLLQSKLQ